jgi:hypothetical protein
MQPTPDDTRKALLKLLSAVAGPSGADVDETQPAGEQINLCIERTQAEASEGAALVDQGQLLLEGVSAAWHKCVA